jgi:hypothetical protein
VRSVLQRLREVAPPASASTGRYCEPAPQHDAAGARVASTGPSAATRRPPGPAPPAGWRQRGGCPSHPAGRKGRRARGRRRRGSPQQVVLPRVRTSQVRVRAARGGKGPLPLGGQAHASPPGTGARGRGGGGAEGGWGYAIDFTWLLRGGGGGGRRRGKVRNGAFDPIAHPQ